MSSTTDHQILIPSARQKIPYNNNNNHNNGFNNGNNSNGNDINKQSNTNNSYHKKSQSLSTPINNNYSSNSSSQQQHSQPITINSSSSSSFLKNNNSRKNRNNQSSSVGSFKKINDQTLSREIDQSQQQQQQFNNNSPIIDDNNTRLRAKSFQNTPQFTPKQALTVNTSSNKSNKQLLNVSNQVVHSKSIPNSLNDTFEVSKSTLINGSSNNNNLSPSKFVKIMTPPPQRKKKQLVEDNYSSSAPSKISLKFDDNEEENELLDEVLDDLCIRFILNCPTLEEEQMEGIDSRVFETLFFQLEEAFWFYYDFHRVKHKSLPKYKFSMFCEKMYARCPILEELTQNDSSQADVDSLVQRFLDYKTSVPVYGCIILNENLDKVLLVQGYNTKSWSFPKGKINQNEKETTCAAREVYEECGYELGDRVNEQDFIEIDQNYESSVPDYKDKYKHSNPYTKLFIVGGIPESTQFATRTRKEILKIKWFSIDHLYETCYPRHKDKQGLRTWLVKPFLNSLIDWIKKRKQPTSNPKTPDKKPVNRSNRSLTAPAIPNLSVSTIVAQSTNQTNVGSPLLSFVFDTDEILEKKK